MKPLGPLMLLRPQGGHKRLLRAADGFYHGLNVPVTFVDYMAQFVLETDKPFIADPSTYYFVLRPERLIDPDKKIVRPWLTKLAKGLGAPFEGTLGRRALAPSDFPEKGPSATSSGASSRCGSRSISSDDSTRRAWTPRGPTS